jgi:hypothetical protein
MKKFTTLLLMITILFTFTQKAMAIAPFASISVESGMSAVDHCQMQMMNMDQNDCEQQMVDMQNCANECEMMSVVSLLHFIEEQQQLLFATSQLRYHRFSVNPEYYFSEPLYRPPFYL